jgi:hypothetical protein
MGAMRYVAAGAKVFRPFGRGWMILFVVALLTTFGAGGGVGGSTVALALRFSLLGVLLASLVVGLAVDMHKDRAAKHS